jgi:hypothetical protein
LIILKKKYISILKTKGKNPPKQESLVFLETTVHRVGEKAENQRKTRERSKVAENQNETKILLGSKNCMTDSIKHQE